MMREEPKTITVCGFEVTVDNELGHLMVSHGGDLHWDTLQLIKNGVWGEEARAIEVYPANSQLINNGNYRHLWRLGPNDFCPDLVGDDNAEDSLLARHSIAWAAAREVG